MWLPKFAERGFPLFVDNFCPRYEKVPDKTPIFEPRYEMENKHPENEGSRIGFIFVFFGGDLFQGRFFFAGFSVMPHRLLHNS